MTQNDMKLTGRIIRKAREAKSITQMELAKMILVSTRTIIALENGRHDPTFSVIHRLIHALDIPADLIFRPNDVHYTMEHGQFFREFLSATYYERHIAISAARGVWRGIRESGGDMAT